MKVLGGVLVLGAALMMSGCAVGQGVALPADELVVSTVPRNSTPGFLAEIQDASDLVDEVDVTSFGIDVDSLRFQGDWGGKEIFLGVSDRVTVNLVVGVDGEATEWGSGTSIGNAVIGTNTDWLDQTGRTTVQYLPQGTEEVPEGWTALSDWVIVRK